MRVLGASAYKAEHIIPSEATLRLIRERGEADMKSEIGRFCGERTLMMGKLEVRLMHADAGHTAATPSCGCLRNG